MSVIPHEWEAALLYCVSVVAPVNRKPMKRKKRQIVKDSNNSAGCKILNDLGKSIWENSIGNVGEMKAKAQDFLVYRDTRLRSKSPALCAGLKPDTGTRRDMEDGELPWQQLKQRVDLPLETKARKLREEASMRKTFIQGWICFGVQLLYQIGKMYFVVGLFCFFFLFWGVKT